MEQIKKTTGNNPISNELRDELTALDRETVEIDGARFKPSQCYRLEMNPPHVLFNTNCPEELKQKLQSILSKYTPNAETGAS